MPIDLLKLVAVAASTTPTDADPGVELSILRIFARPSKRVILRAFPEPVMAAQFPTLVEQQLDAAMTTPCCEGVQSIFAEAMYTQRITYLTDCRKLCRIRFQTLNRHPY
jgi:hypothetical protein